MLYKLHLNLITTIYIMINNINTIIKRLTPYSIGLQNSNGNKGDNKFDNLDLFDYI